MKKCIVLLFSFLFLFQSLVFATDLKTDYPLEKIVILSRHNLRAPLNKGKDSLLYKITPHTWAKRPEKSGELSSKGGELEVLMGQYFKKRLENENFIPENYMAKEREVRFYANSLQRTIATARHFAAGMLPISNIQVEWRSNLGTFDSTFNLNFSLLPSNEAFKSEFQKEYNALKTQTLKNDTEENTRLVEKILDFKNSAYAKENDIQTCFYGDNDYFTVSIDNGFHLGGSVTPIKSTADALILEYYETGNPNKAAFGHELTLSDWQRVGRLQSIGLYSIFRLQSFSKVTARPMLNEIYNELTTPERKFSFLCGHDTNIVAILSAIDAEDYKLQNNVEPLVPIGVKFIIEKRKGNDGKFYANLMLVYQSEAQIRMREPLSLENPPMITPIRLKGLKPNKDGLYLFDDVLKRFALH